MISAVFIKRPILATVLSIVVMIGGFVSMAGLPITQYPDIAPVQVTVSTNYPGADAETVASSVAAPLEKQINGVDNMLYMQSSSSATGNLTLKPWSIVTEVLYDKDKGRATGVRVLDAVTALGAGGARPFLVLAPRHPERFDGVAAKLSERGLKVCRRSGFEAISGAEVFLIDTIGELARAYSLADAAFIGGSLVPTGGHNPLEAAVWRVPVVSGRHVHNFREVYLEMTAAGGAVLVADGDELGARLGEWLADPAAALFLLIQRLVELFVGQQFGLGEQFSDS